MKQGWPLIKFEIRKDGEELREVVKREPVVKVGRMSSAHLSLDGEGVSRMHAYIQLAGNEFFISDLGSAYGTFVNGQRVNKAKLKDGDRVEIGEFEVTVRLEPEDKKEEADDAELDFTDEPEEPKKRALYVYYCEQCFQLHGNMQVLEEGETGPECPKCGGGWKLNRGQARHLVSMQLQHYMKLAAELGMLDGVLDEEDLDKVKTL